MQKVENGLYIAVKKDFLQLIGKSNPPATQLAPLSTMLERMNISTEKINLENVLKYSLLSKGISIAVMIQKVRTK